jgi:hypothetical protein
MCAILINQTNGAAIPLIYFMLKAVDGHAFGRFYGINGEGLAGYLVFGGFSAHVRRNGLAIFSDNYFAI